MYIYIYIIYIYIYIYIFIIQMQVSQGLFIWEASQPGNRDSLVRPDLTGLSYLPLGYLFWLFIFLLVIYFGYLPLGYLFWLLLFIFLLVTSWLFILVIVIYFHLGYIYFGYLPLGYLFWLFINLNLARSRQAGCRFSHVNTHYHHSIKGRAQARRSEQLTVRAKYRMRVSKARNVARGKAIF